MLLLTTMLTACGESKTNAEDFKFLGQAPFSEAAWKQGDEVARSSLIYDFLNQQRDSQLLTRGEVLERLGKPTTYATQEFFPAYTIAQGEKRYVVVFVPESPKLNSKIVRVDLEEYPAF